MSERLKTLIINDDPVALRLTQRILDEDGFETTAFTSAADAVSALSGGLRPDLIVADLHMPGIDGWKLCRLLRGPDFRAFNETPILVVSATFTGVDVESITADLGANAFLPAPFHPETLRTYVRELIQGAHPQRALKVLLVDDDADLAASLAKVFTEYGYDVTVAGDGRTAIMESENTRFDVYILDYHLPDTHAGALMGELRRPDEAGVVLIMTGDDDPDLPIELLENGAEGYLRKPFDPRYLVDMTQKARRERSLLRVEALLERRTNELRESDARVRALFRAIPDWVVVVNWQGIIVQANEAAFRAAPEEMLLVGRPLREFLEPEGAAEAQDHLAAAWSTGRGHFEAKLAAGSREGVVEVAAEVTELDGDPVLLLVARDITARRNAEEAQRKLDARIQHAQRMESLGVLAGGIAHDFNNLLVGILGNASLALSEVPSGSANECLRHIESSARRASELTNQILTFAGHAKAIEEDLDVGALLRDLTEFAEPAISRQAKLHLAVEAGMPPVGGDPSQLRQAMMSLILNASEALEGKPGAIGITARLRELDGDSDTHGFLGTALEAGRYVEVEVTDDGVGMDATTRMRAFEPFFTTKFTGRGLGLSATLGIVQAHHGAIRAESDIGAGSVFRVLLPVSAKGAFDPPREEERTAPEGAGQGEGEGSDGDPDSPIVGGKVLIVDDEPTVLRVATMVLRRAGMEVFPVTDGRVGLDAFEEDPGSWTLVVSDLTMPGFDGRELVAGIRKTGSRVPVLFSSGFDRGRLMQMIGPDAEPYGFLHKPYKPRDLIREVEKVVRQASRARSRREDVA